MKKILVVYHSQEKGNTHRMAELVARGCSQVEGVSVELINVNETRPTMDAAEAADGYALGSPDYFGYVAGNLKQFFDDILLAEWAGRSTTKKPYAAFLTHGGGGSAIDSLEQLAKFCKLPQAAPSVVCKGAPEAEADVAAAVELGRKLAEYVAEWRPAASH